MLGKHEGGARGVHIVGSLLTALAFPPPGTDGQSEGFCDSPERLTSDDRGAQGPVYRKSAGVHFSMVLPEVRF